MTVPDVATYFLVNSSSDAEDTHFSTGTKANRILTDVTVAVCTYNRSVSLSRFLRSIYTQSRIPKCIVIVDASPDNKTELMIREIQEMEFWPIRVEYWRVKGSLKGLTRQRNFAARHVKTSLIAYFDDDIILGRNCLEEMERAHRALGDAVVGVGAKIGNTGANINFRWKLRHKLGIIPNLEPGQYHRTGFATTWVLPITKDTTDPYIRVDWIPGLAMMWKTDLVKLLKFNEQFIDYSAGEDLEFSLRTKKFGNCYLAQNARVIHMHDEAGRPNNYKLGYMIMQNSFYIHQTCLENRTWCDTLRFFYARGLDGFVRSLDIVRTQRRKSALSYSLGLWHGWFTCLLLTLLRSYTPFQKTRTSDVQR